MKRYRIKVITKTTTEFFAVEASSIHVTADVITLYINRGDGNGNIVCGVFPTPKTIIFDVENID